MAKTSTTKKSDDRDYTYVFNKVFTGKYLDHNLGHEVINFIKMDNGERYIYLNPWGNCNKQHYKKCRYVFHIIKVNYEDENENENTSYYELMAVSEIDTEFNNMSESKMDIKYQGLPISEIFKSPNDNATTLYTFKASKYYKPKEKYRILFKFNCSPPDDQKKENKENKLDKKIIKVLMRCYPKHHIAYSKDVDAEILKGLRESEYLEEKNDEEENDLKNDEQCFAVISDRTNLENSMSNQIVYFLNQNKEFLDDFIELLNKKVPSNKIDKNELENMEIIREEHNIDILLKSETDVIVIENKIDSKINGKGKSKKESQLSNYYKYVSKQYKNLKKHFFILKPNYNHIQKNKFKNGDDYKIISYDELYEILIGKKYEPYDNDNDEERAKRNFLYDQFKEGIEYVKSSKAEQKKKIAYIRLNQKIKKLQNKN